MWRVTIGMERQSGSSGARSHLAAAVARLKRQVPFASFMTAMLAVLAGTAIVATLIKGEAFRAKEWLPLAILLPVPLIVFVPVLAALDWASEKLYLSRNQPPEVFFDAKEIRYSVPRKEVQRIAWDSLARVLIVTTDEGPFVEDVFWLLVPRAGPELRIANSAKGFPSLLGEMQKRLAGFDNRAVAMAMGSTSNAAFEVWHAADVGPMHG